MNTNSSSARKKLCDKFLSVLETGYIPWHQSWATNPKQQYNVLTKAEYKGLTQMILSMECRSNPGWITKSQAKKMGWTIKNEARFVLVEKFEMQEKANPSNKMDIDKFIREATKKPNLIHFYDRVPVSYILVNINDIENVPAKYKKVKEKTAKKYDIEAIKEIPNKLGARIVEGDTEEEGMPTAYYLPSDDSVHIPDKSLFKTDYGYTAVKLHELCHSTSHPKRLDRSYLYSSNDDHNFGSEGYAREELRAEIASAFLMQDFGLKANDKELTNHMGYIQSWVAILKSKKEELSLAIDDAYRIEEYILNSIGLK